MSSFVFLTAYGNKLTLLMANNYINFSSRFFTMTTCCHDVITCNAEM